MGSIEYLITQAKNRNEEAIETIIESFQPKLKKVINCNYFIADSDVDDLKQELTIKILQAINKFNFENIPGFWEFLNQIENL